MTSTKIGIVTCGLEPNYGACLQAFSTLVVVRNLGFDAELMNYSFFAEKSYLPLKQPSIKSFIAALLFYQKRKKQWVAFDSFRKERMNYSQGRLYSIEDFKKQLDNYSLFIVGSDQVWNPYLGIDTNITLLSFFESRPGLRKISYASSFGVSMLPEELKDKYKRALLDFDSISTRETTGQNIVKDLIGKECDVVVDPVVLQTAEEWGKYEDDSRTPTRPYILIYDMNHNKEMVKCASYLGGRYNIDVLVLSSINLYGKSFKNLCGVSPSQFLSLIRNSKFVVTDSFHGTVFSLIYNKEFFAFYDNNSDKLVSRLSNILSMVKLEDRLLTTFEESTLYHPIEYGKVNQILEELKRKSLSYLETAVSNAIS